MGSKYHTVHHTHYHYNYGQVIKILCFVYANNTVHFFSFLSSATTSSGHCEFQKKVNLHKFLIELKF